MDLEELGPRLREAADRVGPEVERVVHRQAGILRGMIRARASGRPGPNVITGRYRSSWELESFAVPHGGGAEVGTNMPYGRRLEFGFWDMYDSLGRHFFQPPYPHVGPSVDALSAQYRDAFGEAVDRIFGGGS